MSDARTVAVQQQRLPDGASYTFDQVQKMAVAFAKSEIFGVSSPDQALALMLYAQATGKHPALIMRDYDIIKGRLAKKSEAMLRDFQASGGRVEWVKYADDGVTGVFTHPLAAGPLTIDWDMERAKKAGLAGKDGAMYSKYSRAMFRSRCISEGVRTIAPEATDQVYTPEEVVQIEQEAAEPAIVTVAVKQATDQVKSEITEDELDALVGTLDVKTLPELTVAFGKAYTRAKEANDEHAKKKLKANYDAMKEAIEAGEIK